MNAYVDRCRSWVLLLASETLTGVTQLKIGDVCWRASETVVLGVDNAKSGTVYVICVYRWYVCPLNARAWNFLLNKLYFILQLRSVRKFRRKRLFFKRQKVAATGYYGIENPFPEVISKPIVGCQEPLVVRMP